MEFTIELNLQIVAITLFLPLAGYVWLLGLQRIEVHLHNEWVEQKAARIRLKPRYAEHPEKAELKVAKHYKRYFLQRRDVWMQNLGFTSLFAFCMLVWSMTILYPGGIGLVDILAYLVALASMGAMIALRLRTLSLSN